MASQMQPETFWREITWPPASCEAETITSIKRVKKDKIEGGNCFYVRLVLSIKPKINCHVATNLEGRERERKRKQESR